MFRRQSGLQINHALSGAKTHSDVRMSTPFWLVGTLVGICGLLTEGQVRTKCL